MMRGGGFIFSHFVVLLHFTVQISFVVTDLSSVGRIKGLFFFFSATDISFSNAFRKADDNCRHLAPVKIRLQTLEVQKSISIF